MLFILNNELFDDLNQVSIPTNLLASLRADYPADYFTDAQQVNYNGTNYYLIYSKLITDAELDQVMRDYLQQNFINALQGNVDFCDMKYNSRSIGNYIRICTGRDSVCECELLKDATQYCDVFSEILSSQIQGSLGSDTSGLGGLLQILGGLT
jgi:hypothetical protein